MDLLTVFVGIIALAVLAHSVALIAIGSGLRRLGSRIDVVSKDLLRRVDSVSQQAGDAFAAVKAVAAGTEVIRDNLVQSTALVRNRVAEIDAFLADATKSVQLQMAALEDFLETTRRRLDETFDAVQQGILTPIREIGAIIAGVKTALNVLGGRSRRSVDRYRNDDGMFV